MGVQEQYYSIWRQIRLISERAPNSCISEKWWRALGCCKTCFEPEAFLAQKK